MAAPYTGVFAGRWDVSSAATGELVGELIERQELGQHASSYGLAEPANAADVEAAGTVLQALSITEDGVAQALDVQVDATAFAFPITEAGNGADTAALSVPVLVGNGAVGQPYLSVKPTTPPGIANGDILVLVVNVVGTAAVTVNQGYTLKTSYSGDVSRKIWIYWKRTSGTEVDPTVTDTNFPGDSCGIIAIRGCVTSGDPFDVNFAWQDNAAAPFTTASITTTSPATLLLHCIAGRYFDAAYDLTGCAAADERVLGVYYSGSGTIAALTFGSALAAGPTGTAGARPNPALVTSSILLALLPAIPVFANSQLQVETPAEASAGADEIAQTQKHVQPTVAEPGAASSALVFGNVASYAASAAAAALDTAVDGFVPGGTVYSETPTEAAAAGDALVAGAAIASPVAEGSSASDALAAGDSSPYTAAEGIAASDLFAVGNAAAYGAVEPGAASDAFAAGDVLSATVPESASAGDTQTNSQVLPHALGEVASAVGTLVAGNVIAQSSAESGAANDFLAQAQSLAALVSEAGSAGDVLASGNLSSYALPEAGSASVSGVDAQTRIYSESPAEGGAAGAVLSQAQTFAAAITEVGDDPTVNYPFDVDGGSGIAVNWGIVAGVQSPAVVASTQTWLTTASATSAMEVVAQRPWVEEGAWINGKVLFRAPAGRTFRVEPRIYSSPAAGTLLSGGTPSEGTATGNWQSFAFQGFIAGASGYVSLWCGVTDNLSAGNSVTLDDSWVSTSHAAMQLSAGVPYPAPVTESVAAVAGLLQALVIPSGAAEALAAVAVALVTASMPAALVEAGGAADSVLPAAVLNEVPQDAGLSNLLTYSQDLGNAAWTKNGTAVVVTDAAVAPDGTLTADQLSVTVLGDNTRSTAGNADGGPYTGSVWVRAVTATVTVSLAVYDAVAAAYVANTGLQVIGTSWTRLACSGGSSIAGNAIRLYLYVQQANASIYVWGLQVEPRAGVGPYQVTVASAVPGAGARPLDALARSWSALVALPESAAAGVALAQTAIFPLGLSAVASAVADAAGALQLALAVAEALAAAEALLPVSVDARLLVLEAGLGADDVASTAVFPVELAELARASGDALGALQLFLHLAEVLEVQEALLPVSLDGYPLLVELGLAGDVVAFTFVPAPSPDARFAPLMGGEARFVVLLGRAEERLTLVGVEPNQGAASGVAGPLLPLRGVSPS